MKARQNGAAVIMALFIVVLCTLTVSPLIWTLFATSKTVQVSNARTQTLEVTASAIDWARVIIREDRRISSTDNLTEPWAVPLAESRLSEGLMRKNESVSNLEDREAVVAGQIVDAQSLFNLRNLGADIDKQERWKESFEKLCNLLSISIAQRQLIEELIEQMYPRARSDEEVNPNSVRVSEPLIPAKTWEDLREGYGIEQQTWQQLKPHVVFLPRQTTINANTASAEVIYSGLPAASFGDAQSAVAYRERVTFNDLNDLKAALSDNAASNNDLMGVASDFFLVKGAAQIGDALVRTEALLERQDNRVLVLWRQ